MCSCLAQISKHSVDLAEVVVEAEIFPGVLNLLKDLDVYVRKNAATCIREVAKHTPELAQLIGTAGGVGAMGDYVTEARGNARGAATGTHSSRATRNCWPGATPSGTATSNSTSSTSGSASTSSSSVAGGGVDPLKRGLEIAQRHGLRRSPERGRPSP